MTEADLPGPSAPAAGTPPSVARGTVCELPGADLWVREEPGEVFRVGLTDAGQKRVGEIVYFRGPRGPQHFEDGEPAVSLESSKWVGHLALPAPGELLETNARAVADPSWINREPLGCGWLYRMRPDDVDRFRSRLTPSAGPRGIEEVVSDPSSRPSGGP